MKLFVLIFVNLVSIPFSVGNSGIMYDPPVSRASFYEAYSYVRAWEGNYVNHQNDKGGETYAGISRRYHPNWYGWRYVDMYPNIRHTYVPEAELWVRDFYLTIWVREGYYKLTNQQVANYLFDMRVHISKRKTKQILCGMGFDSMEDSYVWYRGMWYTHSINDIPLDYLRRIRLNYYKGLVKKFPKQKIFIKGWERRANV